MQVVLNEWAERKAVIREDTAAFYLNGGAEPALTVPDLKHGKDEHGSVGFSRRSESRLSFRISRLILMTQRGDQGNTRPVCDPDPGAAKPSGIICLCAAVLLFCVIRLP